MLALRAANGMDTVDWHPLIHLGDLPHNWIGIKFGMQSLNSDQARETESKTNGMSRQVSAHVAQPRAGLRAQILFRGGLQ